MRAAVSTRYGPPDVVRVVDDAPDPEVGPDDLLVRVHATTVNRTDCALRRAYPFVVRAMTGWRGPKFPVWGTEYAGVVERVGPQVTRFAAGRPGLRLCRGALRRPRRAGRGRRVLLRRSGSRRGRPAPRGRGDRGQPLRPEQHPPRGRADQGTGCSCTARPVRSGRRRCSCSSTRASTSSRPPPPPTSSWCAGWAPGGWSTSRSRTSPPSTRPSTSCSTSSARAPSGPAARSWRPTGSTCRATSGRSRRTSRCRW